MYVLYIFIILYTLNVQKVVGGNHTLAPEPWLVLGRKFLLPLWSRRLCYAVRVSVVLACVKITTSQDELLLNFFLSQHSTSCDCSNVILGVICVHVHLFMFRPNSFCFWLFYGYSKSRFIFKKVIKTY